MKHNSSRYFYMVFILTLLIGTLPSIIVGSVGYFIAYNSVINSAISSSQQHLRQTSSEIELSLSLSERMLTNFIQMPQLEEDMSLDYSPKHFRRFNNLSHLLNNLYSFDIGLLNSYIINLNFADQ